MEAAAEALSTRLWNLRERLEHLVYALNAQQLFLASGRVQYIEHAAQDVSRAAEAVGEMDEVVRTSAQQLAAAVGAAQDSPLSELAALCPDPWRGVLVEHRLELARLRADVEQMVKLNKEATRRVQNNGPAAYSSRGEGVNLAPATKSRLNTAG